MEIIAVNWARADEAFERGKSAYVDWCREVARINADGDRQQEIAARYGMSQPSVAQACMIGTSPIIDNVNNLPADTRALYDVVIAHKEHGPRVESWLAEHPAPKRKDVAELRKQLNPPTTKATKPKHSDTYKTLLDAWKAASDAEKTKFLDYIGRAKHGDAAAVLEFLNEKTGRNYRPTPTNLNFVTARLKEGYTIAECRMVIARKTRQWKDDERMSEYLRPATLFNAEKFNQYIGECVIDGN